MVPVGGVGPVHPLGLHLSWQFLADGDLDPAARTDDALEVWTGPFQPDDEAALLAWDDRLRRGWRVWANGGSDLHGVDNTNGFNAGTPTTVVYADALSRRGVVEALRAGRCFVTRRPDGVEAYLRAEGPGDQRQIVGGTIHGAPLDRVDVEVLVRRAAGMRCVLIRDGVVLSVTPITSDEQRVTARVSVGAGGYVRAEVRGAPEVDPANPLAGRTDVEAFTNPSVGCPTTPSRSTPRPDHPGRAVRLPPGWNRRRRDRPCRPPRRWPRSPPPAPRRHVPAAVAPTPTHDKRAPARVGASGFVLQRRLGAGARQLSAAEGVGQRRAHPLERVLVHLTHACREHRLRDRVQAVAVDDRLALESDPHVVELDLRREAPGRRRDFGDRDERSKVDDLVAGEHEDRATLATDLGQPDLAAVHASCQASARAQKSSTFSGDLR